MIFWSRSSSALFLPDRAPFDGLILRYETTFYFPVRFRKIKRFLFFNLSLSRSGKETRSKQTRKSWFKWKSRGIDNFNTFRRGWKVSRGVGVTNRGADGGWISTSCKLGVEGGGLHCGHCDEIKEGDDEEINARGASCTDSIVEIYHCRWLEDYLVKRADQFSKAPLRDTMLAKN